MSSLFSARFPKGHIPWNKGLKGIHLSPATEFKRGQPNIRIMPVGTVRIRQARKSNLKQAWVKVGEPNLWKPRCRVVWEAACGSLPRGWVLHYRDFDSLNDDLRNLQALSRGAHLKLHRLYFEKRRKALASMASKTRWVKWRMAKL